MQQKIIDYFNGRQKEISVQEDDTRLPELKDHIRIWSEAGKKTSQFNPNVNQAWATVKEKVSGDPEVDSTYLTIFYRIAASLLIVLGGYLLYQFVLSPDAYHKTILADNGLVRMVSLADGSTVWVNSGSSVTYSERNPRSITLDGEAFFQVAPDAEAPFVVAAGGVETRVLGTEFNVAGQKEKVTIDVLSGIVEVNAFERTAEVVANTRVEVLKKEKLLRKSAVSDYNFLFWKTGVLEFTNTPLSQILKEMSWHYKADISSATADENCSLTVSFDNTALDESLDVLATLLKGTVEKAGSEYFIHATDCGK